MPNRPKTERRFRRVTTSPGVMLREEFMVPLSISQNQLASDLRVPPGRINQIINGKRGITSDTALRLAKYFGNSPEFWLNLQQMYDLSKAQVESGEPKQRHAAIISASAQTREKHRNHMSRPNLPDFARPPVYEVVLSIQFQPLSELRMIHLGSLWERLGRDYFASVEEQPPVPRVIERFGILRQSIAPQFEIINMGPLPRVLFVSSKGDEIVQVQKDRFTFNWRKRSEADVYPRYEWIEQQFSRFSAIFAAFLRDEKLGSLKVEQAEVTYINRVPQADIRGRIEEVISVLSGRYTDSYLHDPEEVRLSLKFPMLQEDKPFGRLHIDVFGSTQAGSPVMNLLLLARGMSMGNDISAAIEFFRAGRAAIVNGFASITSKEMHQLWGRTDDLSSQI